MLRDARKVGAIEVSNTNPNTNLWIARSLLISAVIALVIGVGFYLFFRIHQELNVPSAYAWWLGGAAFLLSAVAAMFYFRTRPGR
jgi:multidrug transporter EmrE-like cation transporter